MVKSIDQIKNIVIVGAGTMGHSIAQVYAQYGFKVTLVDVNQDALERALINIKANFSTFIENNTISSAEMPQILERINISTNLSEVAKDADLVIEAVNEDLSIKEKIFHQLEQICSEDTILASNTSGLNIYKIVGKIKNPGRLIIHHWFAPPHIIPLVEIVPGRKTSSAVKDLSVELMERLGKKAIVLKKFEDLFIVNKIQLAIGAAVFELMLKQLASPEDIDLAVKYSLGIRLPVVGVAQTFDFTGLDVLSDVLKSKGLEISLIKEKLEKGELGVKTGKGIYDYNGKSEAEILRNRDMKYLQMLDFLQNIKAFNPIN